MNTNTTLLTFVICIFFLASSKTYSQTEISGTISTNTTLTAAGSPYTASSHVFIEENVTLTIEPGVVIKHEANGYWTVDGTLLAQGTAANPIVFTEVRDDVYGGDSNNDGSGSTPAIGTWYGINIRNTGGNSIIDNCLLRYGGRSNWEVLNINESNPTVSNNHFYQNAVSLSIAGYLASPQISNNIFEDDNYAPVLKSLGSTPVFNNNQFINCAYNAIALIETAYSEPTYTLSKSDIAGIQNVPYIYNGNIRIAENSTLTIETGVIMKALGNGHMTIDGTLLAQSSANDPIVFTEWRDDSYGGDTNNDGNASSPVPSAWYGINITSTGGASIIDNCLFSYAGRGNWEGLNITNSNPTVSNNHFYQNGGSLGINGSSMSPQISNNIFEEDTYAPILMNLGATPIFSNNQYINCVYNAIALNETTYSDPSYTLGKQDIAGIQDVSYIYNGNINIAASSTLTIEPGVVIKALSNGYMTIDGTLLAQGTSADPIIFTEWRDDTYGGDTNNDANASTPLAGAWYGIEIRAMGGNSIIDNCLFHYAGRSSWEALNISDSNPTVSNNHFYQNGGSLSINGSTTSPQISNNIFEEDTYAPVFMSLGTTPVFSNNQYTNCAYNAIAINEGTYSGTSYTLGKQDIAGLQSVAYIFNNNLKISAGSTLTIESGVIIKALSNGYMTIDGTILAQGTTAEPIIFTEWRDDTYGGDTNNDGTNSVPAASTWYGINITAGGGNSIVDNCVFRYAGRSSWEAVNISDSDPTISNNHFYQNGGSLSINGSSSNAQISNNIFEEDTFAPVTMSLANNPVFSGNQFTNCAFNAIAINPGTYSATANYTLAKQDIGGLSDVSYIISDDITLGENITLTIDPGVVIKFTGGAFNSTFTVNGTLIAQGTAAEPIVFTEGRDDALGGDTNNNGNASSPGAGAWEGINMTATSGASVIDKCSFRYGGYSGWEALNVGSNITVNDCHFYNNGLALSIIGAVNPMITNNIFEDDTYAPVTMSLAANPMFSNNQFINCVFNAISINTGTYSTAANYTLSKQDIAGFSDVSYIIGDDLTIGENVSLTIEPGVVIKFTGGAFNSTFTVNGTLIAQGTSAEPIVFTEGRDDTHGGDTNNNGSNSSPGAGAWEGINITETSTASVIDHCKFRHGGYSGWESLNVRSDITVSNNHFFNNGLALSIIGSASPQISNNIFEEDTYAPITMSLASNPVFSNNQYINCNYNALSINTGSYSGTADYTLIKRDVAGFTNISYVIGDDITIGADINLTIEPGIVIKFTGGGFNSTFTINGTLDAQGTSTDPIVFTEGRDDLFGGDTNNNGNSNPVSGAWEGIHIPSTSNASIIDNCLFRAGGYSGWEALNISNSNTTISNNLFNLNAGALSISTSADLRLPGNTFEGNSFGIENNISSATLTVDSCSFVSNQRGIINQSPFLVVANSQLLDNTIYDIENLDTEDVQAGGNWWGEDDYALMELNNDTIDFPYIFDIIDDDTKGRVIYYPPLLPDSITAPANIPDLLVSDVFSGLENGIAGDTVTVTWNVTNIGEGFAVVDWTENVFIQAPDGSNKTLVGQIYSQEADTLQSGSIDNRSLEIILPNPISIGDMGVFVVELVPAEEVNESPLLAGNNFAVEPQAWAIDAKLSLTLSDVELTENGASLYCIITRNGTTDADLIVDITPSAPARFDYPSQVTIAAGQSGKSFYIAAIDNVNLEGPLDMFVTASAAGFTSAEETFVLLDDEIPALTISNLAPTIEEGDLLTFDVSTNFPPTDSLFVYVISSDPEEVPIATPVVILPGETTVSIQTQLQDDIIAEPDNLIVITAGSAGLTSDEGSFTLIDENDIPAITFELTLDTISESAGLYATQGVITRLGSTDEILTVDISASQSGALYMPSTVPLGPGEMSKTFDIGVLDNNQVDGLREIEIIASVLLAACNCSASSSSAGTFSDILAVADNDGPSLSILVNPLSLAEGAQNAGTLTIERNTPTDTDLVVTLTSSDITELILPATVTIPAGSATVDVSLSTETDSQNDGNQQVTIQADATAFSPGITWVIVTDINKPDLSFAGVTLPQSIVPGLAPFQFRAFVINEGLSNAPSAITIRAYLSDDILLDDDDLTLGSYVTDAPIPVGDTLELWDVVSVPDLPGSHYLLFEVNPNLIITETQYVNNVSGAVSLEIEADYSGTAIVDDLTFLQGMDIPIYGTAVGMDGQPRPSTELEVYIMNGPLRRSISVTTDIAGEYTTIFEPLPNEGGNYTVGASFPEINVTTVQDEFDILGLELNAGEELTWEVLVDQPMNGTIAVKNLSSTPLTNVNITAESLPSGVSLSFDTLPVLAGNETLDLSFTLTGTEASPNTNYQQIPLVVSTTENAMQELTANYYCQAQEGYLRSNISSINRTVSSTETNSLEFIIFNDGIGPTGEITVDLPSADFMSLVTLPAMPSIESGDTALVILQFNPAASLPLNTPATGTIVINADNGNFLVIPYTIEKVSDVTGGIIVDVRDEYTYFTEEAPHVANAQVKISHYFTGEVFAEGATDSDGLFSADDLPEGTLRITVQANQHESYDGIVNILPGTSITEVVFISYQAISFTWDVVPTEIEDSYQIDLVMEFETNVPAPVVTIEVPDTMPQLIGNETYNFYITLTNHGLITANDVEIFLPNDSEYEFITNYTTADLLAQQAIQVPVVMRFRNGGLALSTENEFNTVGDVSSFLNMKKSGFESIAQMQLNCTDFVRTRYSYICVDNIYKQTGELITYKGRVCSGGGSWNPTGGCGGCPPAAGGIIPVAIANSGCGLEGVDCIIGIIGGALGCIPGPIGCGFSLGFGIGGAINSDNNFGRAVSVGIGVAGCIPGIGCAIGLAGALGTCIGEVINQNSVQGEIENLKKSNNGGLSPIVVEAAEDVEEANNAFIIFQAINEEVFGPLATNENFYEFGIAVSTFTENVLPINAANTIQIKNQLSGFDIDENEIDEFIIRWNESLVARGNGIYKPDATYPNIIDAELIASYIDQLTLAQDYAITRGYTSIEDMYYKSLITISEFFDEDDQQGVCASVSIHIGQELTMTREAFEGTLGVVNGHPTDMMSDLSLNLEILNPQGVLSNDLFQIELNGLDQLTGIDGTGQLSAQAEGSASILFIPERAAAPTVPVSYSFGGSISYLDPYTETLVTVPLIPVTLQVNPSPDLYLHYFMQRDIYGDDALTDPIEPIIPAELAVMIENNGFGTAMDVTIESSQPEIIDNEKGLAIDFNLIGSKLQGQPANMGLASIDFNDIDPLSTKIGQWYFTSTLLGHFINYETNLVHLSSYGNPDLSLVSGAELHELIHSISVYNAEDGIDDFLVNEIQDANETPDAIYLSQGNLIYDVFEAQNGFFTGDILAVGNTNTLHVDPTALGWNYIKLDDPGDGNFELVSVTRSDGQEIPLKNAWLSHVTIPDSRDPLYENKFHFVDDFAAFDEITYTVVWSPKDINPPFVVEISGQPALSTSEQVTNLIVTFSEDIIDETFDINDLTLTFQGGSNIIDNTVIITQLDSVTYDIDLSNLTTGNGFYAFTVQAAEVQDLTGTNGLVGEQATWTQFLSVPSVQSFIGLPEGYIGNAFDTVQLLFNLPIDVATLTPDKFSILLDGVSQTGNFSISEPLNVEGTLFELTGLGDFMSVDGDYEFVIDLLNIKTTDDVFGIAPQSIVLTLDTQGPQLINLLRYIGGGLDDQHYTGMNMNFDEDVIPFDTSAVSLWKDGVQLDISMVDLSTNDESFYQMESFDQLTYPDGSYAFRVDMSTVFDQAGNAGTGIEETSWTVNRTVTLAITDLSISPDMGISSIDAITATNELDVSFNLSEDAQTVNVYQVDNGIYTLRSTLSNAVAGGLSVPIAFDPGGNTAVEVQAIDINGNESTQFTDIYIDESALNGVWSLADGQNLTAHPPTVQFTFSDELLDDSNLEAALVFTFDNTPLSTANLGVNLLAGTTYEISGLDNTQLAEGNYIIGIDLSQLHKYTSGLAGNDVSTSSWNIIMGQNTIPVAEAGQDTIIMTSTYTLDGTNSYDPDNDEISFQWYAPDGITLDDPLSATPTFTIPSNLSNEGLSFLLSVSDGEEFSSDIVVIYLDVEVDTDCPSILQIGGNIFSDEYKAQDQIISMGKVLTGENVIMKAGNNVLLDKSFEVESSATFVAEIQKCRLVGNLLDLSFNGKLTGAEGEEAMQINQITYVPALVDDGISISGTDLIFYPSLDNINHSEGTIEAIVQPNWLGNDGVDHTLFNWGFGGGMVLEKDANNSLNFIVNRYGQAIIGEEISVGVDISDWVNTEWYHIAATWSSSSVKLYINGVLVNEASPGYALPDVDNDQIIIGSGLGSNVWDGVVDEFYVSDYAKPAIEITELYDSVFGN